MSLSARGSDDQSSIIHRGLDAALNSIVLEGVVCGMYTVLLAYTLSRLVRTPNRKAYTAALFILWTLVMTTFCFDWILLRSVMVVHNSSPLSMFEKLNSNGDIRHMENSFSAASTLLADAILIWRCFTLWSHKKWALVLLPVTLVVNIVIASFVFFIPPTVHKFDASLNNLVVAFFLLSVGITAAGTFLIILRIVLVTRQSPLSTHHRAYRRVQAIVLESGIIYTVAILVSAITFSVALYSKSASQVTTAVITGYSEALLTPIAGIGPTLIAARVGEEAKETTQNQTRPLTHLMFKRTTRRDNTSGFGSDSDRAAGSSDLERNENEKLEPVGTELDNRRLESIV